MSPEFNKDILFNNISYLLKEKDMKVGAFESAAGVSLGYMSRSIKDEKTKPGLEFAFNASEILGESLDALVKTDLTRVTSTEQYIMAFLQKLTNDTNDR